MGLGNDAPPAPGDDDLIAPGDDAPSAPDHGSSATVGEDAPAVSCDGAPSTSEDGDGPVMSYFDDSAICDADAPIIPDEHDSTPMMATDTYSKVKDDDDASLISGQYETSDADAPMIPGDDAVTIFQSDAGPVTVGDDIPVATRFSALVIQGEGARMTPSHGVMPIPGIAALSASTSTSSESQTQVVFLLLYRHHDATIPPVGDTFLEGVVTPRSTFRDGEKTWRPRPETIKLEKPHSVLLAALVDDGGCRLHCLVAFSCRHSRFFWDIQQHVVFCPGLEPEELLVSQKVFSRAAVYQHRQFAAI